uniref:Uncharacterized protein n=1 Tax=Anguilla anguilla TaxID=7936 RepID=A0A0E9XQD0_ANGAN
MSLHQYLPSLELWGLAQTTKNRPAGVQILLVTQRKRNEKSKENESP